MSNQDDAAGEMLLREVDEDLRREYYAKLWSRYGNWVIAAAILVVAIVAGYEGWQAWQAQKSEQDSLRFNEAVVLFNEGKADEAIAAFDRLRGESSTGYSVLAGMQQASLLLVEKKPDEARAIYAGIANDSGVPQSYRDVARLSEALLLLDTDDVGRVEDLVRPLTAAQSPWRPSALEITAAALLKLDQKDRAIDLYRQVAEDQSVANEARIRASGMLAALGYKAQE